MKSITKKKTRVKKKPASKPVTPVQVLRGRAVYRSKVAAYMEGYLAHDGQTVQIVRPLVLGADAETEQPGMYLIRAADGWEGHAQEKELEQ